MQLPFDIITLDYNKSQNGLNPGDKVDIEHVEGTDLYTTEGTIISKISDMYKIKFKTKYGTFQEDFFSQNDVFSKIRPDRIKYVQQFPEFNSILIYLDNIASCHFIDLNNPSVVKYEFPIESEADGKYYMISPQHLLFLPRWVGAYGTGCIINMSDTTLNVELNPSLNTLDFVKENKRSSSTSHVIVGDYLYMTNGIRILIFNIHTGEEVRYFNLGIDKYNYPDSSIHEINGRVFTNVGNNLFEIANFRLNKIAIPQPERVIYSGNSLRMTTMNKYDDKLLLDIPYYNSEENFREKIFSEDDIISLLDVLQENKVNFKNHVLKFIKTKMSALREEYPTLKIIFLNKELKNIVSGTNFDTSRVTNFSVGYPRYVTECTVLEFKLWADSEFLAGLKQCPSKNSIDKIDQTGSSYCDYLTRELFKDNTNRINKEMLIQHYLCQTMNTMRKQIFKAIKYEDMDGLPLDFSDYVIFDGKSFERKDYSKIELANGEIVANGYLRLDDKIEAATRVDGESININLDGKQIVKPNHKYSIKEENMPYHEAVKLDNIKDSFDDEPNPPSKTNFIARALLSSSRRYDEQRVEFLVWKESYCTIKVPLTHSPRYGLQSKFGYWCNNCYITYSSKFIKIVKIKS